MAQRRRGRLAGRRYHVAWALLCLHVATAPLWLAGVFSWGVALGALTAWLSACAAAWAVRGASVRRDALAIGILCGVGVLWTALQALPLPCDLIASLQPIVAERVLGVRGLISEFVPCTLSLDHGNTRIEVVKGLGILLSLSAAHLLATAGRDREVLLACLFGVLLIALVSIGHLAVGATSIFGLFEPPSIPSRIGLLSPIINPNHLGGFLLLGVPLALGFALGSQEPRRAVGFLLVAILLATTIILTLSRGAIVSLVSVVALQAMLVAHGRRHSELGKASYGLLLVPLAALGVAVFTGLHELSEEFATGDLDKLATPSLFLRAVSDFPLLGTGRGSFTVAALPYVDGRQRYSHVESFPLHFAIEWGLPFACILIAGLAVGLVRGFLSARSPVVVGALLGLLAWVSQNLLDFNIEMSGVALVAATIFGATLPRGRTRGGRNVRVGRIPLSTGLAVTGVALLALSGLTWGTTASEFRGRLAELEAQPDAKANVRYQQELSLALAAHPAEPTLIMRGAVHALDHNDASALRWVNRAMVVAPNWGGPDLLAAQALWRMGAREQALSEVRLGAARDPVGAVEFVCTLLRRDAGLMRAILPDGDAGRELARATEHCIGDDDPAAAEVDRLLVARYPALDYAWTRIFRRASDGPALRTLRTNIRQALKLNPDKVALWVLLARTYIKQQRYDDALSVLDRADTHVTPHERLLRTRIQALQGAGRVDAVREVLRDLQRVAAGDRHALARAAEARAVFELEQGNLAAAVAAYQKAYMYAGDAQHLLDAAAASERAGDWDGAFQLYSTACRYLDSNQLACSGKQRMLERASARP